MAQVPTTAMVDPKAAEQAKVTYSGDPEFKPIEGTSMQYATNTADKVIKVGDVYYLCLQGVWFMSPSATGPWTTANSVPKEIYTIPPSSPVYNVTYVTQSTTPEGTIQSSYTAGYLGTFIAGAAVGAILASGTGYYYPPYYGYPVGGYPIYRPYAATYGVGSYYNTYSGAYGVARGVYGPYGGAAAGAAYNPYTGTYARGATAYGPYGSRSVAQAYNPYTGTYAATQPRFERLQFLGTIRRIQWQQICLHAALLECERHRWIDSGLTGRSCRRCFYQVRGHRRGKDLQR